MSNSLSWREKTLGEMMTELKARLGFVTQGAGSKLVDPILKSFLQEGRCSLRVQREAGCCRRPRAQEAS